jgi:hypothetical protein
MNHGTSSCGLVTLTSVLVALVLPSMAGAAVLPANPSNLGAVFGAAQGGDVIELAPGDYGQFTGGAKPATVTIRPQAGAAVTMSVAFSSANNIRIEGVTMDGADISGSSKNIAIAGSRFTNSSVVNAASMVNANIVFDRDSFAGIDPCANCYEGRLQVAGQGPGPSGVTIQNSQFGPGGTSDGIQTGADGVQIVGNEFVGIKQTSATHTDALQLYGATNTVIRGNYFHDIDTAIMAPDGGDHEVIADNVLIGGTYRPAVQLGSHDSTQFVHNTVKGIDVFMDKKSENPTPSTNGVVSDNILINGTIHAAPPTCTNCQVSYNLFSSSATESGTNALVGTPVFVGGVNPLGYTGFLLAPGSPGKASASDGADRGARIVLPTTAPSAAPAAAKAKAPSARLRVSHRITWAQLRHGLRARVSVKERVRLSFWLARRSNYRSLKRMSSTARKARTYVLRPRRARLGHRRSQTLTLRVTATNAAGGKRTLRATIRVRR